MVPNVNVLTINQLKNPFHFTSSVFVYGTLSNLAFEGTFAARGVLFRTEDLLLVLTAIDFNLVFVRVQLPFPEPMCYF